MGKHVKKGSGDKGGKKRKQYHKPKITRHGNLREVHGGIVAPI